MKPLIQTFVLTLSGLAAFSQAQQPQRIDKVSHAEPISFDLIRDLGARKGEKEWNVGIGMSSMGEYTAQSYFIEYEFAPVNRLGLEIELPFHFTNQPATSEHRNGLEGVKAAAQYSFYVSSTYNATLAIGYIFEFCPQMNSGASREMIHTPFFIAAKKWKQLNALLGTGPSLSDTPGVRQATWLINANLHYVLPGTKNFVGIEFNDEFHQTQNTLVIHPQIKMVLSKTLALGIALGVPASSKENKMDFLMRWIYEPSKNVSARR